MSKWHLPVSICVLCGPTQKKMCPRTKVRVHSRLLFCTYRVVIYIFLSQTLVYCFCMHTVLDCMFSLGFLSFVAGATHFDTKAFPQQNSPHFFCQACCRCLQRTVLSSSFHPSTPVCSFSVLSQVIFPSPLLTCGEARHGTVRVVWVGRGAEYWYPTPKKKLQGRDYGMTE